MVESYSLPYLHLWVVVLVVQHDVAPLQGLQASSALLSRLVRRVRDGNKSHQTG